jgi:WD40 repeat protein
VGNDQQVIVWDLAGGQALHTVQLEGPIMSVAVTHAGDHVLAGLERGGQGAVWILDADLGNPRKLKQHSAVVMSLRLSQDDKLLVSSSMDHTVELSELSSGNLIARLKEHREAALPTSVPIDIVPAGDTIVSGGPDNTVQVWRKRADGSWTDPQPPPTLFGEGANK